MTTVGFIGSGNIGSTVARLAIAAGYDVVLSNSRGPQTLADLVKELGPRARAATPAEAAQAGDLVVVTVPLHAYKAVPAAPLAGKTVLDTNNYYPDRDGRVAALDEGTATTSGLLREHLAGAHVVKAFNNIYYVDLAALARPKGAADRSALPIAADDAGAKAAATAFLDAVGYDAVDAGPLDESWRQERDTPVYVQPYRERPAPAEEIVALLAEAKR
ncbi:NADP oxidoreductase [Virgisporangium aliadipatigenens]|uniref:NADP oxidoreductase n=1 Tax=Virgisporangium aliadipatigenens TaxID=741659 RepID=A0A8J3YE88_9ACTN|nr:NAD(P)-binding domain-containing protein [Virgisporangium aliadipatigenens]GIJ43529.1 NADP oxidoreductase [Virgisporangium aliadipatigenens]